MFGNNKKKLDLAEAARQTLEKENEKEKQEHEAAKKEIRRLLHENESMRVQLNKAVETAGSAMNGRWYADDGRYCGEIKMPQLIQATGTVLNLKVIDDGGVTKGIFLAPDSKGKFTGNRLEWDVSPDETGTKVWERKERLDSGPDWFQIRIEEMRKERDVALLDLANATKSLQDQQKLHEATKADLEALRKELNIDPSKTDIVGENRSMKVELVQVKGDLEATKKDLEAARRVTEGLKEVIEGQSGEVEHSRRQRTTWELDRSELVALRSSQQSAEAEIASLRKELQQCQTDYSEAKAKAEEATKNEAIKISETATAEKRLEEEVKAHEELKVRLMEVQPENDACRAEAENQKRKATFSVQAHEFARQAHESLRAEHEKISAELGRVQEENKKLQKFQQENEVLKVKSEHLEAHLKAITIEHDERKKVTLDLVEKLEDMKMKHSILEREHVEKSSALESRTKVLESIQKEFSSACQVFDTPYSDYLRSTKGQGRIPQGTMDMAIPGSVHQSTFSNQLYSPAVTQIVIGRVGQVVVEN